MKTSTNVRFEIAELRACASNQSKFLRRKRLRNLLKIIAPLALAQAK